MPAYVALVEQRIVEAVRAADAAAVPARAEYATAKDESLLGDFRLPEVYDGVMRMLRFTQIGRRQAVGARRAMEQPRRRTGQESAHLAQTTWARPSITWKNGTAAACCSFKEPSAD